jgi:hypothetical protein
MTRDADLVAEHAARVLPLASASLSDAYFYASLPLCVIDAVYSIGVRYESVQNVVARYCAHFDLRRVRKDRTSLPDPAEQESISAFCAKAKVIGPDRMAAEVFRNRQRTSTRSGILKSEAVQCFAQTLRAHGVEYLQDVPTTFSNPAFKRDIRNIPGQGSGISLHYFWMLTGSDGWIKPDRMVLRFLESVLGRAVSTTEAQDLLGAASDRIRTRHPHLTPRLLDYLVWEYQRKQSNP